MKTLAIDIETFCHQDLRKTGVYAYAEHASFEILLLAYSFNKGPVKVIDIAQGEKINEDILQALVDPKVLKTAFNANFERICLNSYLKITSPINQWECTMVKAAYLGLPLSLQMLSKVLNLNTQKMEIGSKLIRHFCLLNYKGERKYPHMDTNKWQLFKEYCITDVIAEQEIREKLEQYSLPQQEKDLYILDQEINDRGIKVDIKLVDNALRIDLLNKTQLIERAKELTQLENPNSLSQIKAWINERLDTNINLINKETIPKILASTDKHQVKQILKLRQELAKTSVRKYEAIKNSLSKNERVRGLFQFYGANRTGRWAGRLVQVQNLPHNNLTNLARVRHILKTCNAKGLENFCGSIPKALSQLLRTAFIAKEGYKLVVADFSAIEARVIAWLANEKWRLEVFNTHGKIYEASAAAMFGVDIAEITKGSELRQKGKVAELALGYQGSTGALISMGALKMGILEEELLSLVKAWRRANPAIVKLWASVQQAAILVVKNRSSISLQNGLIRFYYKYKSLFIELPSGRVLAYYNPKLQVGRFDRPIISYEGLNQSTKSWGLIDTYGGKLVENIVQAIARDCLGIAMLRVKDAGYDIIMHVHDEIVVEGREEQAQEALSAMIMIMSEPISWATGLGLRAEGFCTDFYRKE